MRRGCIRIRAAAATALPRWMRANRGIENTAIVLWYALGFHHVVRAEDWPAMPTSWHQFELQPLAFSRATRTF